MVGDHLQSAKEKNIMAELETTVTENTENTEVNEVEQNENPEIAKLKAELAKQKAALDKATKEAGDAKKALRAKQSAEEAAAEEAKEAAEARDKELAELRKKFAVAETSKKVMGFVGDEQTASAVAEYLYGAEDIDELGTEDTTLRTVVVLSCSSALCRVKVGHQRARTLLSLTDILYT